jgi:hypothetical protein
MSPGKPTGRKAQLRGGNRMAEKRMPVAERQRETETRLTDSSSRSSWITGRIRTRVVRPERALTRSGEPVRKTMT